MAAEIEAPAGFVPQYAVAFGIIDAPALAVHAGNPLPVRQVVTPGGVAALAGTLAASAMVGPFAPELGRPIRVTLSGSWSGTVELRRSIDGGATTLPLTAAGEPWGRFTGNANEPVAEESEAGATYHLAVTMLDGTLTYRVAQ